jgi:SpoVK/Ycf46/Vps4 family AAA+-type ATPase
MAITAYKTLFSEYHSGPTSFIHMLSKPIAPTRDVAINQDDTDKLRDARHKTVKKINTMLIFYGDHNADKAMELNQLAYHSQQSVCFIDCQRLVDNYIGETEKHLSKLIAQAGSQSWILFFDKADVLFSRRSEVKDAHHEYANQEVSYVPKCLSQYPGLSILSLTEKPKLEMLQYAVDSFISFR